MALLHLLFVGLAAAIPNNCAEESAVCKSLCWSSAEAKGGSSFAEDWAVPEQNEHDIVLVMTRDQAIWGVRWVDTFRPHVVPWMKELFQYVPYGGRMAVLTHGGFKIPKSYRSSSSTPAEVWEYSDNSNVEHSVISPGLDEWAGISDLQSHETVIKNLVENLADGLFDTDNNMELVSADWTYHIPEIIEHFELHGRPNAKRTVIVVDSTSGLDAPLSDKRMYLTEKCQHRQAWLDSGIRTLFVWGEIYGKLRKFPRLEEEKVKCYQRQPEDYQQWDDLTEGSPWDHQNRVYLNPSNSDDKEVYQTLFSWQCNEEEEWFDINWEIDVPAFPPLNDPKEMCDALCGPGWSDEKSCGYPAKPRKTNKLGVTFMVNGACDCEAICKGNQEATAWQYVAKDGKCRCLSGNKAGMSRIPGTKDRVGFI